ncbi:MAG: hypothetical protein NDI94_00050 [Candidatus Woesearchaeota archaeon]|nr:hypothetical protein [Candidatus Woesearchaeota archaeon]
MTIKIPDSMDEVVYWTTRKIGEGQIKAWAYREDCPECGKAKMGKPQGEKGNVKIRATYYECPLCKHTIDKKPYEDSLTAQIMYTCPKCKFKGETEVPYKRKKYQGVDSIVFSCGKCAEKIPITKKLKGIGEKD